MPPAGRSSRVKRERSAEAKPAVSDARAPADQPKPAYNPFEDDKGNIDPAYLQPIKREPGVPPEPDPGAGLKDEAEEDIKPVIHDATVQARQAALTLDVPPDHQPALGPAPVPKHHPKAALLRKMKRDPFPDFARPAQGDYQAVCDQLAVASTFRQDGSARDKWPAFQADDITDDSVLYGLVDGILGVQTNYRAVWDVMDKFPRVARPAADEGQGSVKGEEDKPAVIKEDPKGVANPEAAGRVRPDERVDWREMMGWSEEKLAGEIRTCGGQNKKAFRIKAALDQIDGWQRSIGKVDEPLSLGWLRREASNDKCLEVYLSFAGVGLMTAMNEMAWTLGRDVMGVDTNTWKMCTYLGWIPWGVKPEDAAIHLNLHVPKELRFALHQLFWLHPVSCDVCSGSTITTEVRPFTGTGVCPIERWLNRTGPGRAPRGPAPDAGGAVKGEEEEDDEKGDGGAEAAEAGAGLGAVGEAEGAKASADDEPGSKRRRVAGGEGSTARSVGERVKVGAEGGAAILAAGQPLALDDASEVKPAPALRAVSGRRTAARKAKRAMEVVTIDSDDDE